MKARILKFILRDFVSPFRERCPYSVKDKGQDHVVQVTWIVSKPQQRMQLVHRSKERPQSFSMIRPFSIAIARARVHIESAAQLAQRSRSKRPGIPPAALEFEGQQQGSRPRNAHAPVAHTSLYNFVWRQRERRVISYATTATCEERSKFSRARPVSPRRSAIGCRTMHPIPTEPLGHTSWLRPWRGD